MGKQEEQGGDEGGEGEGKGRRNLAPTVISRSRRLVPPTAVAFYIEPILRYC